METQALLTTHHLALFIDNFRYLKQFKRLCSKKTEQGKEVCHEQI